MAEELEGFHGNLDDLDQSLAAVTNKVEETRKSVAERDQVDENETRKVIQVRM